LPKRISGLESGAKYYAFLAEKSAARISGQGGQSSRHTTGVVLRGNLKFVDSPLEGNGFELPVPLEIGNGFDASAELGPIDRRRGGIIRAVVGLGKPIELLRRLEESSFTAA
jgi:hypothetical protein